MSDFFAPLIITVSKIYKYKIFFIGQLVDGLVANDLHHYSHLLTGYVGSASFLEQIAQLIPVLKKKNPNLIYCS